MQNRLIVVKEGDKILFIYRYDGMRKAMSIGTKTISFHCDEDASIMEQPNYRPTLVSPTYNLVSIT